MTEQSRVRQDYLSAKWFFYCMSDARKGGLGEDKVV